MKKLIFSLLCVLLPLNAWASGGEEVHLDRVHLDLHDKESLQRGAKWFTNYCMGCHALGYSRYERVADDLEIPHDVMLDNLVFPDKKIGELMDIAMPKSLAKKWFGAAPPDLTLVARARGPEWVYTYLRSFYVDDSRPLGVNNLVFKDVGMPHAMLELQGTQTCKEKEESTGRCSHVEHVEGTGLLSPKEFDAAVYDMVNFLEYVGEPMQLERKEIGVWVLIYVLILGVFCYFLNREYWKDIH